MVVDIQSDSECRSRKSLYESSQQLDCGETRKEKERDAEDVESDVSWDTIAEALGWSE